MDSWNIIDLNQDLLVWADGFQSCDSFWLENKYSDECITKFHVLLYG